MAPIAVEGEESLSSLSPAHRMPLLAHLRIKRKSKPAAAFRDEPNPGATLPAPSVNLHSWAEAVILFHKWKSAFSGTENTGLIHSN